MEEEGEERADPEVLAALEAPERRFDLRRIGAAALLIGLLVGVVIWAVRWGQSPYRAVPARVGLFVEEVSAVGTVEPAEVVDVSSRQSGTVERVEVQVNDQVEAGQVLARLDTAQFSLAVEQAQAQQDAASASAQQALAELRQAQGDLARIQRLNAQGAATEVERIEASTLTETLRAQLSSLQAQRAQAEAATRSAQEDLDEASVTSPIAGVVLRRDVEPGATVVSAFEAQTLFVVASSLDWMVAEVDIDEADIVQVRAGQPATFTVTAWPDARYPGEVTRVDLAPDPSATTVVYVAELSVDNREGTLRPGMTVTAQIEVARTPDAILVPVEALRYHPEGVEPLDGDHLWILQGREATSRPVRLLGDDGTHAAVQGVEAGELIIVEDAP